MANGLNHSAGRSAIDLHVIRVQGTRPTVYVIRPGTRREQRLAVLAELRLRYPATTVDMIGDEIACFGAA